MRRLRIVIGRSPRVAPAIAAVSLMPALGSCGSRSGLPSVEDDAGASAGGSTGGSGGQVSGGGSGGLVFGGGGAGFGGTGGLGGSGGNPWCPPFSQLATYDVTVPPPGVPADPGQLCAVTVEPVESNTAARVTLTKFSAAIELAQGFIAIPPSIEGQVVGSPKISVKSAIPVALSQMSVSSLTKLAGGFAFLATWPGPLNVAPDGGVMLQIDVELELACDPSGSDLRTVSSRTEVHLCIGASDLEWVSSGDECTVCKTIAEMAPTPILPDQLSDGLPLPRAFRLRVVELARAGRSVLLFAENDAGPDAAYEWHASAGRLEQLAPDLVLWSIESSAEPGLLQVALEHAEGAAVASFDWEPL